MKFVVFTLGCKVNLYEGQAMIACLESKGHEATDRLEKADCYIINTCSVTGEADRKSRQTISRVKRLNPDAPVFVCGCSSQNDETEYTEREEVRLVCGTSDKIKFVGEVLENIEKTGLSAQTLIEKNAVAPLPKIYEDDLFPVQTRTRGLIKIQDGCNNFCSYCIIPYLRGRSRSRSIKSIVEEARRAAETSREIVLTGINISAFGADTGEGLTELIEALGAVKARKRFGSLENSAITESLIEAMAQNGFCPHFHLSMQSGSESVLKRMNRHYTPAEFIKKVELIRKITPFAGITTDIIAGFPGETDAEHRETAETMRLIRFSDAHIFPYSRREGTKAANMPDLEKSVKSHRAAELSEIRDECKTEFIKKNAGTAREVYIEENDGEYNTGYTDNYIKIYSVADVKSLKKHVIKQVYKDGATGVPLE